MSLEVHIEKKLNGFTLRSDLTAGNTATAILGASGCNRQHQPEDGCRELVQEHPHHFIRPCSE